MRWFAAFLSLGAFGGGTLGAAAADPPEAAIGITLNPIVGGVHESFDDRVHVPPVPVPLLALRAAYGPGEVDLEGLPPLASVRSRDAINGRTSTQLSIFDGTFRVWDPLHRYSAGVGAVLYNQSTHYLDAVEIPGTGQTQFSRMTGMTWQIGYGVPVHRSRFEAVLEDAPAMRGIQYTDYDVGDHPPRVNPERAAQLDAAIRYAHPAGPRGTVSLGLRYINFTATYDRPAGGLADRNVGLLPSIGYAYGLVP